MIPTLALDPATRTGWAWTDGSDVRSGVWMLKGGASEHAGLPLVRLERLILETHSRLGIDRIVFERSAYGGDFLQTKQFHNQVRGIILATAAKIDASWADFSPTSIKAFAGHGSYGKPDMLRALHQHYPQWKPIKEENEVDALWILLLSEHHRTGAPGPPHDTTFQAPTRKKKKPPTRKQHDPELF